MCASSSSSDLYCISSSSFSVSVFALSHSCYSNSSTSSGCLSSDVATSTTCTSSIIPNTSTRNLWQGFWKLRSWRHYIFLEYRVHCYSIPLHVWTLSGLIHQSSSPICFMGNILWVSDIKHLVRNIRNDESVILSIFALDINFICTVQLGVPSAPIIRWIIPFIAK